MPHAILVIHDRASLDHRTRSLERAGFSVAGYTQPEQSLSGTVAGMADIAIVDAALPRMGAGGLIRRLAVSQSLPVLVLVRSRNDLDEIRYLNDGAADVIERTTSGEVLVARANALLRRVATVSPASQDDMLDQPALRIGALSLQPSTLTTRLHGCAVDLTVTEFRILYALVAHPEMIRTRSHLQDLAYGNDIHVIDRAIDSHIKRLRQKIRVIDPDFDSIQTVYGLGYRFRAPQGRAPALALAG